MALLLLHKKYERIYMMTIEEIVNSHRKGKCCCINLIARKRQCAGAKFLSGKIPAEEAVRLAAAEKNNMEKEKGYALMQAFELLPYTDDDCITRPFFYYKAGTPLWVVKRGIERVYGIKEEEISEYYINPFCYLAKRYFGYTKIFNCKGDLTTFGVKIQIKLLSIVVSCYNLAKINVDCNEMKSKLKCRENITLYSDAEAILKNWTEKPFDKNCDYLTKEGREAFSELIGLLYDFANLYGYSENIDEVVEKLSYIVDDDYALD